jgi:sugar phosphate isomerase/epimerase
MTKPYGKWDLSYYMCVMAWTGSKMDFEPDKVRERLKIMKAAGIEWIGVDGINTLEPSDQNYAGVVSVFRDWLDKAGLRLSSFHYSGPTFAALDQGQDTVRQHLVQDVELFRAWQPRAMVIHADWIWGVNSQEGLDRGFAAEVARHGEDAVLETVAANLKVMAKAAQPYGIRLAIENMGPYGRLSQIDTLPRLVAAIDEPNAGFCLDSGHAHLCGDNVAQWVVTAGKRLFETHFHDNRGHGNDEHWPAGFGTISWVDVILALDAISFEGPVTFETTGWPLPDPVEGYRRAMQWWDACGLMAASVKGVSADWWRGKQ